MKYFLCFFLFISFVCNAQRGKNKVKCINTDSIMSRYQKINEAYLQLIETNKNNIFLEDGSYYYKSYGNYSEHRKLYLTYEGKEIFMKSNPNENKFWTFENRNFIEEGVFPIKSNYELKVNNLIKKIRLSYYRPYEQLDVTYYELSNDTDRNIIATQYFVNCELKVDRNYKKDFKITEDDVYKKFSKNFYEAALKHLAEYQLKHSINSSEYEILKSDLETLKKELDAEITTRKGMLFRKIRINRLYSKNDAPVYQVALPKRPDSNSLNWLVEINAKTNKLNDISYVPMSSKIE